MTHVLPGSDEASFRFLPPTSAGGRKKALPIIPGTEDGSVLSFFRAHSKDRGHGYEFISAANYPARRIEFEIIIRRDQVRLCAFVPFTCIDNCSIPQPMAEDSDPEDAHTTGKKSRKRKVLDDATNHRASKFRGPFCS